MLALSAGASFTGAGLALAGAFVGAGGCFWQPAKHSAPKSKTVTASLRLSLITFFQTDLNADCRFPIEKTFNR
jgi:hypothetical protein